MLYNAEIPVEKELSEDLGLLLEKMGIEAAVEFGDTEDVYLVLNITREQIDTIKRTMAVGKIKAASSKVASKIGNAAITVVDGTVNGIGKEAVAVTLKAATGILGIATKFAASTAFNLVNTVVSDGSKTINEISSSKEYKDAKKHAASLLGLGKTDSKIKVSEVKRA